MWWPVLWGPSHLLGSQVPALRIFQTPHTQLTREHPATGFSSLASQHMPSSFGSLRLVVNRFSSTETHSWASFTPLARTDRIIPSVQNLTSLPALGSNLMEKDHTTQVLRARAPDLRTSKCVHSRALFHQSTTPGRHVATLACVQHVCRMGARWRSERS